MTRAEPGDPSPAISHEDFLEALERHHSGSAVLAREDTAEDHVIDP
jgi:hypothetical protein